MDGMTHGTDYEWNALGAIVIYLYESTMYSK